MTAQLTPDKTFPTKTVVPGSWFTDLQTDRKTIARCFYDEATPDLPLAEQKKGTLWVDPTVGVVRCFRIDGAGDPRVSSPLRSMWIPSDQSPAGPPPLDGRVKEGDAYLADDGTDSYVAYFNATLNRFWARGILAEYRTAATGTDSTTKRQASQRLILRGSSWDGAAAVTRDWSIRTVIDTSADGGDDWGLYFECRAGAGSWSSPLSFGRQGSFSFSGSSPCVTMNFTSGGSRGLIFGSAGTQADGQEFLFKHLGWSKLARFRFAGSTDERDGVNALALSAIYGSKATNIVTTVKSAALGGTASYWDGADPQEASWYDQLILTGTTPAGYLRRGFGFGPGTLDLHHYGRLALAGTTTLSGTLADGDAAQTTLTPTYDGAHTVTRHNYRKLANPTLTGSAALTDACRDHYDAAAGTHKALDAAAGGADAWEKVNGAGTVLYGPLFTTKDLGIPAQACGEISLTDGADAQTITDVDEWQPLEGFDAEGLEVGVGLDLVNSAIVPSAAAKFAVTLSVSFTGDAAEYVFAVARRTPGESPTIHEIGRQARVTIVSTEVASVCVECLFDVGSGQALVPLVKTPTGSAVDFTLKEASFVAVKVAD